MFAATIGFIVCAIIGVWILLICLAAFTWGGTSGEKIAAVIVAALVILFLKWINPFTVAITVVGS